MNDYVAVVRPFYHSLSFSVPLYRRLDSATKQLGELSMLFSVQCLGKDISQVFGGSYMLQGELLVQYTFADIVVVYIYVF